MTIYVDISAAVHGRAGLGRYAQSLAQALLDGDPVRFAFFYNRAPSAHLPVSLREAPIRTVRAGYKPWRMAVWLGQLTHLGFDRLLPGAELFHATEHLLMPLRHIPSVLTVHDLVFRLLPHHHKLLNYVFLNLAMPLFIRRADHLIAVSHSTREDLVRLYSVDPSEITVIHEAADPRFRPQPAEEIERVRREHGLPEHFILSLGTIEPRKNHRRLIEALSLLRRLGAEGWRLVVAGEKGWLYQPFFRRLEELGLEDEVILLGHVPEADLPALYSAATLFVFPSLYEGFGLPPLEAMACGTPVVCSRASSLPEVGGEAALYFDPTDVEEMAQAMYEVLRDGALRAEMQKRGLEQAKRFSWERTAEETMAVYQDVIQGA
ncbi:MAG: glycosyltransferase family 1 protein [Chloroflexota bacterium]|nr:glycosyltransferase family 1 protein [Chloroflexota bacterium]